MDYLYRVYAWKRQGGIDLIGITPYEDKAYAMGNNLDSEEYIQYLLIRHDIKRDSDFPIDRVVLQRKKGRVFKMGDNNV